MADDTRDILGSMSRKHLLKPVRRVLVKVGSAVLTAGDGLNRRVIHNLTSKLHAFGPMGLEELTTRKFVVYGSGQVRT
jgi:hypothetical protein